MSKRRIALGRSGEGIAVDYLKRNGYRIIEADYCRRLGQIDIIAKDQKTICFIEVKTRSTLRLGTPLEAVNSAKQRKLSQLALIFLKQRGLFGQPARFDVVSISYQNLQPNLELIKNAFPLHHQYTY